MDLNTVIAELRTRRQQIDEAILALERMNGGKRRGRPPKSKFFSGLPLGGERKIKVASAKNSE